MELKQAKQIINNLEDEFDSHAFIQKFIKEYPESYGELLGKYKNITTANSVIANYLRTNASKLSIARSETNTNSIYICGNNVPNAVWRKDCITKSNKSILQSLLFLFIMTSIPLIPIAADDVHVIGKANPDAQFVYCKDTIIDTVMAEKIFEEKKIDLMAVYQEGVIKQQRCNELCGMKGKKLKDEKDLQLLKQAFEHCYDGQKTVKRNSPSPFIQVASAMFPVPIGIIAQAFTKHSANTSSMDKNVKKGKLKEDVLQYLVCYNQYLIDSLKNEYERIEMGWDAWLYGDDIPYKTVSILKRNPLYRGSNYQDSNTLDMIEEHQQRQGWEFLYSNNRVKREDSYPHDVKYYVYDAAPQYKVLYNKHEIEGVYDKNGTLVYIPSLTRKNDYRIFKDIERVVYLQDYQNNKYGIKSRSEHTQEFLHRVLACENGMDKAESVMIGATLGSAFVSEIARSLLSPFDAKKAEKAEKTAKQKMMEEVSKYTDSDGGQYIAQLRKDHSEEFGYVYIIERLSNVSFRVVYLNKQTLTPSYCAIITYRTGTKPYTKEFHTTLANIPTKIPMVVKQQ
ncbi:MAG: hypothetical protein K2J84_05145 [Bacteroidaceae bacterium]|nr:hypothetical protein [Bacteroidaceae bacterium]